MVLLFLQKPTDLDQYYLLNRAYLGSAGPGLKWLTLCFTYKYNFIKTDLSKERSLKIFMSLSLIEDQLFCFCGWFSSSLLCITPDKVFFPTKKVLLFFSTKTYIIGTH